MNESCQQHHSESALDALREAVRISPEDAALRGQLAGCLLEHGQVEMAEKEYRTALILNPDSSSLKLGLAHSFADQGKAGQALVLLEDLIARPDAPGAAYLLYAWVLSDSGEISEAIQQYQHAVKLDNGLIDPCLARRLGLTAPPSELELAHEQQRAFVESLRGALPPQEPCERPKLTLADVGGMEAIKAQLRLRIIDPLRQPGGAGEAGRSSDGGILLYGPPGCGKTHLARSTAGELGAAFIPVRLSELLGGGMGGNSERNLHYLFERARTNRPCVLFFDEVEALATVRPISSRSGVGQAMNHFLTEIEGANGSNDGVFIVGATAAPWLLNSAMRKAGRFDRWMFVPPPDHPARMAILRSRCWGRPAHLVDFSEVAKVAEGMSAADLMAGVEAAVEQRLEEAIDSGVALPLTSTDLLVALRTIDPGPKQWLLTARPYAHHANDQGVYDDLLRYLKG